MATGSGATPSSGGGAFKTVIIGVVTTVLGAVALYFLNLPDHKSKSEKKLKKEATEKAWITYKSNMNVLSKIMDMMDDKSEDIARKKTNVSGEIESTVMGLENIKREQHIDSRMLSLIDLRITNLKNFKNIVMKYYDDLQEFASTNPTQDEGYAYLDIRAPQFVNDFKELAKNDSTRREAYLSELRKEYDLKEE